MHRLSWDEFDRAVESIADQVRNLPLTGVYGVPRGGLALALALSHRLKVPLLAAPDPGGLLIDDIHDSGRTLEPFRGRLDRNRIWVWVSRAPEDWAWYRAVRHGIGSDWVIFPWEDPADAEAERRQYLEGVS